MFIETHEGHLINSACITDVRTGHGIDGPIFRAYVSADSYVIISAYDRAALLRSGAVLPEGSGTKVWVITFGYEGDTIVADSMCLPVCGWSTRGTDDDHAWAVPIVPYEYDWRDEFMAIQLTDGQLFDPLGGACYKNFPDFEAQSKAMWVSRNEAKVP